MVEPARFTRALRDWAATARGAPTPRRWRPSTAATAPGSTRAGVVDAELFAWRALDALRADPEAWGGTPLFVYGFDDFTALELDALETIAGRCGADVTRLASVRARPRGLQGHGADQAGAARARRRGARARAGRRPLRASARAAPCTTSSGGCSRTPGDPVDAGDAIAFHSAGGAARRGRARGRAHPRAAARGSRAGRRRRRVPAAERVRVAHRAGLRRLRDPVLDRPPRPVRPHRDRARPAGADPLRLAWAAARTTCSPTCAPPAGCACPAWRTGSRRRCARRAPTAPRRRARSGRSEHCELGELDRLAPRARHGRVRGGARARLQRLFAAPLRAPGRACCAARSSTRRARSARARPRWPRSGTSCARARPAAGGSTPRASTACWSSSRCTWARTRSPTACRSRRPEAIRARRFEAVFVCGLQEGEFPRGAAPEPFLPDEDRRAIASATGLVLPVREDAPRPRALPLLRLRVARRAPARALLALERRGGQPAGRVVLRRGRPRAARRSAGAAQALALRRDLDPRDAPRPPPSGTARSRRAGPRREERVAGPLTCGAAARRARPRATPSRRARSSASPTARSSGSSRTCCGPTRSSPTPSRWCAGSYAHDVLEHTYGRLREETGERRVTPANLARAERILLEELRAQRVGLPASRRSRRASGPRRAGSSSTCCATCAAEAERGQPFRARAPRAARSASANGHEPVEIAAGLRVRGRIDRVDTQRRASRSCIDYKSGARSTATRWRAGRRRTASRPRSTCSSSSGCSGCAPRAGCTWRSAATTRGRAGWWRRRSTQLGSGWFAERPPASPTSSARQLGLGARADPADRRRHARRATCCPAPERCDWQGGCKYPSICRSEG